MSNKTKLGKWDTERPYAEKYQILALSYITSSSLAFLCCTPKV